MLWRWIAFVALSLPLGAHEGLDQQIGELGRRIEGSPRDASLYVQRAELHRQHRCPELALVDVERAARIDASCEGLELVRGRALLDSGAPREAVAALTRSLARKPCDEDALLTRAAAEIALGDLAAADADYASAITALREPRPDPYAAHARVAAALGDGERALAILDAGQARVGVNVALQSPAIELEIARGHWDAAMARIDALARQAERKELWLAKRGDVLELAGRRAEALESWRAALDAIDGLPSKARRARTVVELAEALQTKLRERAEVTR